MSKPTHTQPHVIRQMSPAELKVISNNARTAKNRFVAKLTPKPRKEVQDLEKLLKQKKYTFWDFGNIEHKGRQVTFRKKVSGGPTPDSYVFFSYHIDNCGGPDLVVGEMNSIFKPFPNDKHWGPILRVEMSVILKRDWKFFDELEIKVIAAIRRQVISNNPR